MRFRISAVVVLALSSVTVTTRAQDLPTTHDHGITITPDHLTTAIQETQDFWGPVRKHLVSDGFNVAHVDLRQQAVAFLKTVHDGLHDQLFQKTETEALDLIHYLGHRLRRFEVYRRLRGEIGDDAVMVGLIGTWESKFREIDVAAAADRPAKVELLLVDVEKQMQQDRVAPEKIAAAMKLWRAQADVFQKMAATEAGKMMIDFEAKAAKLDPQVAELLLTISNAADWVLICREGEGTIGRDDFIKAWERLNELRTKQATAAKPALTR